VSDHPRDARPDAFAALRSPYVRGFALGRMLATIGAQIVTVAVGWDLYERTGDALALGLVGLATVAPALVLMLPAGAVSDRFPRRNVAMAAHALLALAALGLALIARLDGPVALVYALIVVSGVGRAFAQPSTTTLLAQLLTPAEYQNAYAWLVSSGKIAQVAGPAAGGALIAVTGEAASSYVVAALANLLFVAALAAAQRPAVAPASSPSAAVPRPGLTDLFGGVAFIRRTPVFLGAITLDLFGVLFGGAVALLPVYAKDVLMVGPAGLGVLRAAPAAGAVAMALIATRLPPWRRPGRVMLIAVAGFGLATIVFGLSRDLALSLLCLTLTGACDAISVMVRGTIEQAITPDRLRGRVSAINYLFIGLSNELGAFESGAAAHFLGPVASVVLGGFGTLGVVALVPFLFPALVRVGPVDTLRPDEPEPEASPVAEPARA
jgi:MFS family permease